MSPVSGSPVAVVRPPSPDRLDQLLQVKSPLSRFALTVIGVVIGAGFVWSCLSTAPVKVTANGMLLASAGVSDVTATADGRVISIRMRVGDKVAKDDVVAEIGQPDAADRLQAKMLERRGLQAEREKLRTFQTTVLAAQDRLNAEKREALEYRARTLGERITALRGLERDTQQLVDKGFTTRTRILEITNDRARAENDLGAVRSELVNLVAETTARSTQNERELLNSELKLEAVAREIELLQLQLGRSTVVTAHADGTVTEITANPGEVVRVGAPLMRMLPAGTDNSLVGIVYISGGDGKLVKPAMDVQLVPATARLQRDGYIDARVVRMSDLPATRESMSRVLKNDTLVTQLTRTGPAYEAIVELVRDPATPSGLKWSTGYGLPQPPESGTIAEAKIVVNRRPIISLVIPRAETALEWFRRFLQ